MAASTRRPRGASFNTRWRQACTAFTSVAAPGEGDDKPVVFNGENTVMVSGLLAGACGGIGATYNVTPGLFVQLWDAVQAGNMEKLARVQARLHQCWNATGVVELFAGIKQTQAWMGLECGVPRSPLRPLTEEETQRLRTALERIDFFDDPHDAR